MVAETLPQLLGPVPAMLGMASMGAEAPSAWRAAMLAMAPSPTEACRTTRFAAARGTGREAHMAPKVTEAPQDVLASCCPWR